MDQDVPRPQPPVIGYTLRTVLRHGREGLFQYRVYARAVERAGGVPLAIPLLRDPSGLRTLYDCCDAIMLPGGEDVNPVHYAQPPRADCSLICEPELDPTDLALARWAVEDGKPLLAICRGAQILNVALGGSLWQDMAVQGHTSLSHRGVDLGATAHDITIEAGSRLATITGCNRLAVNSSHHQAVRALGEGLRITATSDDGVVEAIEGTGPAFVLGVQCHPEELQAEHSWALQLFRGLVDAGRERAAVVPLRGHLGVDREAG